MVKANELRLGNFLHGRSGYYKVTALDPSENQGDFIQGDWVWRQYPNSCQPLEIMNLNYLQGLLIGPEYKIQN